MKTKLEGYDFKDQHGHKLENCQDYLDIVDVLEKAKELIEREDWIYVTDLKKALDKVFEKEDDLKTITLKVDENKPRWYRNGICRKCKNLQHRIMKDSLVGGLHEAWCGHYWHMINSEITTCGHFEARDKKGK